MNIQIQKFFISKAQSQAKRSLIGFFFNFSFPEKKCDYESNLLIVITVGVILIFMLNMCALGYFCTQAGRNRGGKQVEGRDNEGAA